MCVCGVCMWGVWGCVCGKGGGSGVCCVFLCTRMREVGGMFSESGCVRNKECVQCALPYSRHLQVGVQHVFIVIQ